MQTVGEEEPQGEPREEEVAGKDEEEERLAVVVRVAAVVDIDDGRNAVALVVVVGYERGSCAVGELSSVVDVESLTAKKRNQESCRRLRIITAGSISAAKRKICEMGGSAEYDILSLNTKVQSTT